MIHHTCGVCKIMYHIWSYVDSMFDNLMIWWSDGGSHILLFNSSAGFQRWVTWLQGEMASLTHTSPPHPWEKNHQIWMHAHPKSAAGKIPEEFAPLSSTPLLIPRVKSRGSGRGFGGWIAPPYATGNGRQCVSLLWVLLLLLLLLLVVPAASLSLVTRRAKAQVAAASTPHTDPTVGFMMIWWYDNDTKQKFGAHLYKCTTSPPL